MDVRVRAKLEEIGCQFDRGISPLHWPGGVIEPNNPENPIVWQEVKSHEPKQQSGPRRPATGSWERPAGRERKTYRFRAPVAYPKGFNTKLLPLYAGQIEKVCEEYPGTVVWHQKEGFWLLSRSRLFNDCDTKAIFLTAVPYDMNRLISSWGFWDITIGVQWIGPRHTNFPFGSICAYEPREGIPWGSRNLVAYLDLYTDWAAKQLYLQEFGRWPGQQSVPYVYERLTELHGNEACGCQMNTGRLYQDCCQPSDEHADILKEAAIYSVRMAGGVRKIPTEILDFVVNRGDPPPLSRYR